MANSVDVHPALTLIALMAGSAIGGAMSGFTGSLVGMLASIPAVAVAKSVFVYYFEKRTGRQLVSADGVFFQGTTASDGTLDPIADATSPHPDISAAFERVEQRIDRIGLLGVLCVFCRARRDRVWSEGGEVGVHIVQLQRLLKAFLQALEEKQRAAEEEHIAFDLAPLREAGDRLVDDRWKMDAATSSLRAPSLSSGWMSDLANTPQRAAMG